MWQTSQSDVATVCECFEKQTDRSCSFVRGCAVLQCPELAIERGIIGGGNAEQRLAVEKVCPRVATVS